MLPPSPKTKQNGTSIKELASARCMPSCCRARRGREHRRDTVFPRLATPGRARRQEAGGSKRGDVKQTCKRDEGHTAPFQRGKGGQIDEFCGMPYSLRYTRRTSHKCSLRHALARYALHTRRCE